MTPTYENLVGGKGIYQVADPTSGKGVGGLISSVTDHLKNKGKSGVGGLAGIAGAVGRAAGINSGPSVRSATNSSNKMGKATSRTPAKIRKR